MTAGRVLVDGTGCGSIDDTVLKDRRRLARDGILLVILGLSRQTGDLVAGPDIIARGVAFEEEVSPLLDEARQVVLSTLTEGGAEMRTEYSEVQIKVRKALRRFLHRRAERRPLILPTIIEV